MFTRAVRAAAVMVALPIHALAVEQIKTDPGKALPLYAQTSSTPSAATQAARSYAQELVDSTARRHPELLELDLHATPPTSPVSVIVASRNAGRIGRKSDPDDLDVIKTGIAFAEINRIGDQNVEVHLPLLDINRGTIGEVEMTFPYPPGSGFDKDEVIAAAAIIRDEMARRILDSASLFQPVQFDPQIAINTYAQFLVDDLLARHPDVEIIAIHARPPQGGTDYPIVASNIGRIGKPADASDLEVIQTGKPHLAVDAQGARLEAKLPLQDAAGAPIGVLAVVFPFKQGVEAFPSAYADQAAPYREAEKIRDELRSRIASVEQLYEAKQVEREPPIQKQIAENLNETALGNKESLPMTKQVASAEALQNASQEGYSEVVKNQAGVAPSSSQGSPSDTISIRGINVNPISNYRLNGGLAVAGVMTIPTEDKERLETLKGANALMFGVASPAGIINLVTKRAGDRDVSTVSLAGNSFGQYYAGVDLGRRFGQESQAGVRVNVAGSHLENGVRDTNGTGRLGSVGADWKVTDRLTLQGDFEQYSKDTVLQASVSILSPVKGVVPVPNVPDPTNLLSGTWAEFHAKTTNAQGRADYILADNWKLIGEVGHSDSDRRRFVSRVGKYNPITGAGGSVTVNAQDQTYINKFERTEVLGKFHTGPFRHDLTLGASRSERDAYTPSQNSIVLTQKQNIFDPIELAAPVFTKGPTSLALQISTDVGLYTYDTIGIGARWKVLVGFRQTHSDQEFGLKHSSAKVNSPAGGFLYDITPTTTVFASYMKGLEDGAIAPVTAVNPNEILAPGISTQKEIGIRNSYFKGLSISASAFDISRVNAVIDSVTNIFSNNGTIAYKGVEAVIAYDINRQWTLNTAAQYLHATQESDDIKINNFTPENTPRLLGNVFATYRAPLVPGLTLTAGVSYVTNRFVNPQDQGTIPGYVLYSGGGGYVTRIAGYRTSFQVNAVNLANKRYWNSAQQGTYGTGMDRTIKFNAKCEF